MPDNSSKPHNSPEGTSAASSYTSTASAEEKEEGPPPPPQIVEIAPDFISGENPNGNCYCLPNWCGCNQRCMRPLTMIGMIGWYDALTNVILLLTVLYLIIMAEQKLGLEADGANVESHWWGKLRVQEGSQSGFYILSISYALLAISGFLLMCCSPKFKRWPGFWWMMMTALATGLQLINLISYRTIAMTWVNIPPIMFRLYEFWCVYTFDRYIKAHRAYEDEKFNVTFVVADSLRPEGPGGDPPKPPSTGPPPPPSTVKTAATPAPKNSKNTREASKDGRYSRAYHTEQKKVSRSQDEKMHALVEEVRGFVKHQSQKGSVDTRATATKGNSVDTRATTRSDDASDRTTRDGHRADLPPPINHPSHKSNKSN